MAVTSANSHTYSANGRRLKAHRKSRGGCGNCKLRKVKCDEQKPSCKRCEVYGALCDYNSSSTDLQSAPRGFSSFNILQTPVPSQNQIVLGIINKATGSPSPGSSPSSSQTINEQYYFSSQDLGVLYRFHARTILTIGSTSTRHAYQHIYSKLVYTFSPLLHCVLTLTFVHDQYLGLGSPAQNATAIAFHWSRAASLLNEKLSAGPNPGEQDALWACAILLGVLAFSSTEADRPEDVWPLNPSLNPDFLRLTEGKKEIWKIANPAREGSLFQQFSPDILQYSSPNAASMVELRRLPISLFRLCGFHDNNLTFDNPYYGPVSVLAQTLDIEATRDNVGRFLSLFGCMSMEYKRLLHQKDPCAMIILAYWYAKVCHAQKWYLWRRAYLESHAICKYLVLTYDQNADIIAAARDIETKCAAEKPWLPLSQKHSKMRALRPLPA